jgi:hypothetical protein
MSDHTLVPHVAGSSLLLPPRELADSTVVEQFRKRLPRRIAQSFSDTQLRAIAGVFAAQPWKRHGADVRLTLPFLKRRFYFVLVAGSEHRSDQRRHADRAAHPLVTLGNVVFAVAALSILQLGVLGVLYAASLVAGVDLFQDVSPAILSSIE